MAALLPGIKRVALPHPQTGTTFRIGIRRGSGSDICLIGAIGPHKGSGMLLGLARHPGFGLVVLFPIDGATVPDTLERLARGTLSAAATVAWRWGSTPGHPLGRIPWGASPEAHPLGRIPWAEACGVWRPAGAGFGQAMPAPSGGRLKPEGGVPPFPAPVDADDRMASSAG